VKEEVEGFDIRDAIPGEPERDYPLLNKIPKTEFNCVGRAPGFYADLETGKNTFLGQKSETS